MADASVAGPSLGEGEKGKGKDSAQTKSKAAAGKGGNKKAFGKLSHPSLNLLCACASQLSVCVSCERASERASGAACSVYVVRKNKKAPN